jgi:hypothetical protein
MKYIKNLLFVGCVMMLSCSPDEEPTLSPLLSSEDVEFSVTQQGGYDNKVFLNNLTEGTIPLWDFEFGTSTRQQDTVILPFGRDYWIKLTAFSQGGSTSDSVKITVSQNDEQYFSAPEWDYLTNGAAGKTWRLDLDADGQSVVFKGPVYFSSDNIGYEYECLVADVSKCWSWEAEWASNQWIGEKGDYGTMTFNLNGGPYVTVEHKINPFGTQSGTFALDPAAGTLKLFGVKVLQNPWASNDIADWGNARIIKLTENSMQLAFHHKTKSEFMIFNYVAVE